MDGRVTWHQLQTAREAARQAQVTADRAWLFSNTGTYESTKAFRDERDRLEEVFGELLERFKAQYDTEARYEVRYFSSLPEYAPRGGVVCVNAGMTIFDALEMRDASTVDPRDKTAYAQVYNEATKERIS